VRLAVGRIKVTFAVTHNSDTIFYGALYLGGHNLNCGVQLFTSQETYDKLVAETREAFERADFPEIIRILDRYFGHGHYSIKNLFRDEQFKVLTQILVTTREDIYNAYKSISDRYAPLARFLNDIHMPPLRSLAPAVEFVINAELQKQFENGHPDIERVKNLVSQAQATNATIEKDALAFAVKKHFDRLSDEFLKSPEDLELLQRFSNSAGLLPLLPIRVNLWKSQNIYDQLKATVFPRIDERIVNGKSIVWRDKFLTLGEQLGFHIERSEHNIFKQAA
jgi:hypothetical protein